MTQVIHKHVIELREAAMPEGAVLETYKGFKGLSVQYQPGADGGSEQSVCLWALIPEQSVKHSERQQYRVFCYGTGQSIPDRVANLEFIGTVQYMGGRLVLHFFIERVL